MPGLGRSGAAAGDEGVGVVQSIDDERASRREPARIPPHNLEAEESLLGVDAALPRRDHRGGRGPRRRRPTSTSRRTATSSTRSGRSTGRASRSTRSPSPRSCAAPDLLDALGGKADAAADPGVHARVGERGPLRQDRQRARAAAPAHRGRGRDRRDGLRRSPTTSPTRSTAPRRWCSRSPRSASRSRWSRIFDALPGHARPARGALRRRRRRSTGVPDRLPRARQRSSSGSSRRTSSSSPPVPAWARPASRSARRRNVAMVSRPPGHLLLDGDGHARAHQAPARGRGARRRHASSRPASSTTPTGAGSATRSAASARRRCSSTTTRTAR